MSNKTMDKLRKKVENFPRQPGIYIIKDERNEVIYVGKAVDLRSRVRNYFQPGSRDSRLISLQIDRAADIDVVVTDSEKEALVLESNFIKQFRPKYNVEFRDDKSFTSIKIDRTEAWPRPIVTRRTGDEDAMYFGPYASAKAARETLRLLVDIFPLRRCDIQECRERDRPCIYGEMEKCAAPCCSDVSEEEYETLVDEVVMFLEGDCEDLLADMRREMEEAASDENFEKAAEIRDRIQAVEETVEQQRVGSSMEKVDRDIFGVWAFERTLSTAVLFVREGNVQDVASYEFSRDLGSDEEIFRSFLNQFYGSNRFIPDQVLVPLETSDAEVLEEWLSDEKGRKVEVICPQRGEKKRVVELANKNARQSHRVETTQEERRQKKMESLQRLLDLPAVPRHVECFDISTLTGREAVGSMVVFREAEPDKSSYRRYRIKDASAEDDTAMMREVLHRRYRRMKGEAQPRPDLAVVDGGRAQLGVALDVLADLGLDLTVAALAKSRIRNGREGKGERVFRPGDKEPVELPEDSYGYRLITAIRDEAHRFAVNYHRKLRRKSSRRSPLMDVAGIGEKLSARIVDHFGGMNKVREADIEELQIVKGVSERLARAIHSYLHHEEE